MIKSALILAAGAGTRMAPLTEGRPKPLIPVAGKPIIKWTIDALRSAGITDIWVLIRAGDTKIRDYFGDSVGYIVQEKALGTANAISCAKGKITGAFICVNGDLAVEPSMFSGLIKSYSLFKTNIVAVTESSDPKHFGVLEITPDMSVSSIEEKPKNPKGSYINAGAYVFSEEIFSLIEKTKKSPRGEFEITDSIMMAPLHAHRYEGVWLDIGKPWDLLDGNEFYLNHLVNQINGDVSKLAVFEGNVEIGKGTKVLPGVYIEGPVKIGENCKIGPNCYLRPHSSIGNNCHIGSAVEIKNSIIMDSSNVPHLSYVGDSIIGENCNFGAGTNVANLRFDDGEVKLNIRGEKESSGRRKFGCVVGDNVKTGINVSIMPGKKISSGKRVPPCAVVSKDL